jgi:hypothetical protein
VKSVTTGGKSLKRNVKNPKAHEVWIQRKRERNAQKVNPQKKG